MPALRVLLLLLLLALPGLAQDAYLSQVDAQVKVMRELSEGITSHMSSMVNDLNSMDPDVETYKTWSREFTEKAEGVENQVEAMQAPPWAKELHETLQEAAERTQSCAVHLRGLVRDIANMEFELRHRKNALQSQMAEVQQGIQYFKVRKKALDASLGRLRQLRREAAPPTPAAPGPATPRPAAPEGAEPGSRP